MEAAKLMLKFAENLKYLADSIQEFCVFVSGCLQETQMPVEEEKPKITLEQVRGVLAEKSRDGFTAEVREIIKRHGAVRLSEVEPVEYEAMIAEAENLK
ncbi:MAG: rRNA biogenesis protein rrp5 [Lachnospiraceae bacterium]|nr:rRNA biogenesis protein rrp5 [Lachnospiraceae bacterium]